MNAKERIQNSPAAKDIAAMLASPQFESASEVALLTFTENLPDTLDAQTALASHYQLEGAKRYMRLLTNLMRVSETPKPRQTGILKPTN